MEAVIVMQTVSSMGITSIVIKKSIFTAHLLPILSETDVNLALKLAKETHPDATHYTYAYVLGADGSQFRYSDDGEPSGTAGLIIYDVLKKNHLTHVLAIIIRDFGGIKLGTGGLIRAYREATTKVLSASQITPFIQIVTLSFECRYEDWPIIENRLATYQASDKSFADNVRCTYHIPTSSVDEVTAILRDISKNQIKWTIHQ
ncbi:MAG: YigZ family protein [Bacilli bacterium]|nr:YigZ family protein [Bacilli bacterium]